MRPFVPRYIRRLEVWNSSKTRFFHTSKSQRYTKSDPSTEKEAHNGQVEIAKMEQKPDYSAWSHESLIERVTQLELELKNTTQSLTTTPPPKKSWKKPRIEREFDPSKYSTRLIALKLAYLGKRYNGFEHHIGHDKPLPTIEEELWKAFNKARLIFPKDVHPLVPGEVNWEGCEYSKCGRTDKGVSAFGQVIGIRVRSNRPLAKDKEKVVDHIENLESEPIQEFSEDFEDLRNTNPRDGALEMVSPPLGPLRMGEEEPGLGIEEPEYEDALAFDPVADEIPYVSILNKILPHDIRILAWCPSPPLDFSARFSCRERQYRYFFTQPAFHPIPHHLEQQLRPGSSPRIKDSWLDIAAMREAAKLYEGLHDFRNFCKVDAGKQITNFERRIFFADIEEVKDLTGELSYVNGQHFTPAAPTEGSPKVYTFTLHGSAFLWHQVRHMVAILFLVGQGLEAPSIVSELLDVKKNPCRPTYEMADDTPLVLWDCVFPHENDADRKNALQWHYQGDQPGFGDGKFGPGGLMDDLWGVWRERKIDEILVGSLMGAIASQGLPISELTSNLATKGVRSQKVFDGGNIPRLQGKYIPVMRKPRLRSVEVVNEEYAIKKGFGGSADLRLQGFRRLNIQPQPPIDTLDE